MKDIISQKSFKKLVLIIFCISIFFGALSFAVLYFSLNTNLGPHYGAAYAQISQYRESLLVKILLINLIFYLFTVTGVLFLGIFFSHRIAGPLFKVKQYAGELGDGKYENEIKFRKNDVINDLAHAFNTLALACQEKNNQLVSDLNEIEHCLKHPIAKGENEAEETEVINNLSEIDAKIKAEIQKIKT